MLCSQNGIWNFILANKSNISLTKLSILNGYLILKQMLSVFRESQFTKECKIYLTLLCKVEFLRTVY